MQTKKQSACQNERISWAWSNKSWSHQSCPHHRETLHLIGIERLMYCAQSIQSHSD